MTPIRDIRSCSTIAVLGLDRQLIAKINELKPGLLVRIDSLPVVLGVGCHYWLQKAARDALNDAIASRKQKMTVNSAYRTLAGQMLLRLHYENGRCGIRAAAIPGGSNHNNASSLDIEDSTGWRPHLQKAGWKWIGAFDPMHYDCIKPGIEPIHQLAVKAFQLLWNDGNPKNKLIVDGIFGAATSNRLAWSPAEGFPNLDGLPRMLRLTNPLQAGDDVGKLQFALRAYGMSFPRADGVFGETTDTILRQFQKQAGLTVSGVADDKTLKLLGLTDLIFNQEKAK